MGAPPTTPPPDLARRAGGELLGALLGAALWTAAGVVVLCAVSLWTLHEGIRGQNLPGYLKIFQGVAIVPVYLLLGFGLGALAGICSGALRVLAFVRGALAEILRPWAGEISTHIAGKRGEISPAELRPKFHEMAGRVAAPSPDAGLFSRWGLRVLGWGLRRAEGLLAAAVFGKSSQDPNARVGPALIEEALTNHLPNLLGALLGIQLLVVFWLAIGTGLLAIALPVWLAAG